MADEMDGVEIAKSDSESTPLLSDQERSILDLYDRLEELQLEIALLKAQGVLSQNPPEAVSEEEIKSAQQDLLKAKALYQVRSNVVESVLIANPILKAVHAGRNATVVEQDLLPLIEQRDALSIALTGLSSRVLSVKNEMTQVESERVAVSRKNVDLATKMLGLAEEVSSHRKDDIQDFKARQKLDDLEAAMKISRQKWRIMKGTASATIAGSGVDWARDPKLLEIVLDEEDDEG